MVNISLFNFNKIKLNTDNKSFVKDIKCSKKTIEEINRLEIVKEIKGLNTARIQEKGIFSRKIGKNIRVFKS